MKSKKTKTFDCVAMKRKAQQAIRAQTRGMASKEEVAFFREGAAEFERKIDAAKQRRARTPSPTAK
jgi:hypothetical protein